MITVSRRPGPIRKYGADVDRHLRHLWEYMGRICSKKMVAAMPLWLPFYNEADEQMKDLLMKISSATIDRHLESFRESARRGLSSTSPSLIKNKIPIELLDHQIKEPIIVKTTNINLLTKLGPTILFNKSTNHHLKCNSSRRITVEP